jgi:hypothetical protein
MWVRDDPGVTVAMLIVSTTGAVVFTTFAALVFRSAWYFAEGGG